MALISCPECKKEISDTVEKCPHCGYTIKPSSEKNVKTKKSPIFQVIGFVTFFISLFSPQLFLIFFVLVIVTSAIISLIRKEKRWGISFLVLLLGFFLLAIPSINESQNESYKEKLKIEDWNWESKGNYTYVRGRIKNDGNKTIRYFSIQAFYLDDKGNILDTDSDNSLDDMLPGMSKEFEIMHKANSDYKRVSVLIDKVSIK